MATYTVPTTDTYESVSTGARYRYVAGAVIDLALAVDLGMPGAELPAATSPFPTAENDWLEDNYAAGGSRVAPIYNYFPDGAISSDALIDTGGDQDYATKVWYGQGGSETLTRQAAYAGFYGADAIKIAVPGDGMGEGVWAFDWPGLTDEVPAGRYRIGFDLNNDVGALLVSPVVRHSGSNVHTIAQTLMYLHPDLLPQRIMLDVYIPTAARIGINVTTTDAIMVNGETPIAVPANIWIGRVIVTEGDAFAFADGDSDGWAWSGTPNASASYGPQP